MNKKAQAGPIAFIFLLLVFLAVWFLWLGKFVGEMGERAIANGNITGVEAFVYANLNMFIFIGLILGTIGYMYFFGGRQ